MSRPQEEHAAEDTEVEVPQGIEVSERYEDVDKTTRKQCKEGTSAGVAIVWKASFIAQEISDLGLGKEDESRIVGIVIRTKGVSILVFEVYLWTGEGLAQRNIKLLQQVAEAITVMGASGCCGG